MKRLITLLLLLIFYTSSYSQVDCQKLYDALVERQTSLKSEDTYLTNLRDNVVILGQKASAKLDIVNSYGSYVSYNNHWGYDTAVERYNIAKDLFNNAADDYNKQREEFMSKVQEYNDQIEYVNRNCK